MQTSNCSCRPAGCVASDGSRNRLSGTLERPRLAVFRSSKHIYAQMVNDQSGTTLVSASTLDPEVKAQLKYGGNKAAAAVDRPRGGRACQKGRY